MRQRSVQPWSRRDHGEYVPGDEQRRSADLERLRLALFPDLPADEGRQRIDAAIERAGDSDRLERVERLAEDPELDAELLRALRRLRP
jgi:hypothetical protein